MEDTILEDKKICPNCGNEAKIERDGRLSMRCGVCRKCYDSQRWVQFGEIWKEEHKEYYKQNKEILIRNRVQYYHDHQEHENAVVRSSRQRNGTTQKRRRIALILLLGAKCISCAYSADIRALVVEHINGAGARERRQFNNPTAYYTYYLDRPEEAREKLQILCCNCNVIKMTERKEYFSPYHAVQVTSSNSPE